MNEIEQILNSHQNQQNPQNSQVPVPSVPANRDPRKKKQMIIGGTLIGIVVVIIGFILWVKLRPTCSDGKKNGGEEGIDCGVNACGVACPIPVKNLQVQDAYTVKTIAGDNDIAVKVYNPNTAYGVSNATYDIIFRDAQSNELFRKSGSGLYMLPGESKHIVLTSVKNVPVEARINLVLKSVDWVKISDGMVLQLQTMNQVYKPGPQSTVETTIVNPTDFDFDNVDIVVVVFDDSGRLLATSTSNVQTLLSQTERYVKVSWPFQLPANASVQVEVGTNIFNNSNFIKRNGTQEKFQQYF